MFQIGQDIGSFENRPPYLVSGNSSNAFVTSQPRSVSASAIASTTIPVCFVNV